MTATGENLNTHEPAGVSPVGESVPATEASRNLGDLLNRVTYGGERIVITRHGRPVAELTPIQAAA